MDSERMETQKTPAIFSVQHFCLHDGPGVRSIVFFKGCPLRCQWCQNPESWNPQPELAFKAHLCIGCKTCVQNCPQEAISSPGGRNTEKCRLCFSCAEKCPSGAMAAFGSFKTIDSVIAELEPEFPYFQSTGGGVTFSGGEPTLFPGFISAFSRQLHAHAVHTTLETCGYFDPGMMIPTLLPDGETKERNAKDGDPRTPDFLSDIDLVLFDIKLFDEERHIRICGKENRLIKKNLSSLSYLAKEGAGPKLWPRLPLIPGITDTRDNLTGWADFLRQNGLSYLTLVPFHSLGRSKRQWLGLPPAPDIRELTEEAVNTAIDIFLKHGISCYAPGEEIWESAG